MKKVKIKLHVINTYSGVYEIEDDVLKELECLTEEEKADNLKDIISDKYHHDYSSTELDSFELIKEGE